MKKKILMSVLFFIIFAFFSITCFAATSEDKPKMKGLGNEITSSINETEENIENFVDMDTLDHAAETRNTDGSLVNGMENAVKEFGNDVENTTNKAVAGMTGNYNAGEMATTDGTEMSRNTWIWIVLAIVAVIIIASVWYYASQRND